MSVLVAGVDVGGTKVAAAAVDGEDQVRHGRKRPTPGSAQEVVDLITEMVQELPDVTSVGVGLPGLIHDNRVLNAPNLTGWDEHFDPVELLQEALGVPVFVGNDADVGLLGEWQAGTAVGQHDVLGVWMGTGIGGSLILGGRPYRGATGLAGEFGHVLVQPGGAMCGCGRRGCVEAYAGRRMMGLAAEAQRAAGRDSALFSIMAKKGKPTPTSSVWGAALEKGDEVATELMDAAVEKLGIAIGSVVNLLDPDLVVLGGGMAEEFGQDLADRVARAAEPWTMHVRDERKYKVAALGDNSGVVGAATLARAGVLAG
ncbi:MAG: ROK family protein [Actinomycetes bacterium]